MCHCDLTHSPVSFSSASNPFGKSWKRDGWASFLSNPSDHMICMSGYTSPYHIQDKSGKYAFWATCDSKPGDTPGLSDYSHLNCQQIGFFVDAPDLHKHVKTLPRNSLVHNGFSKTACSLRFGTGDLGRR